jgi:hypothetical protein
MKPHEETWEVDQDYLQEHGEVIVTQAPDGWTVAAVSGREHLEPGQSIERGRLIAAAPAMARALKAYADYCPPCKGSGLVGVRTTMGSVPQPCPACSAARAALKEAGVLE